MNSILGIMAVLFVACGLLIGILGRGWGGAWLFVLLGLVAGFFPILNFCRNRLRGDLAERAENIRIAQRIRRMMRPEKKGRMTGRKTGRTDGGKAGGESDNDKSELEKELEEIDRRTARRAAGFGDFSDAEWEAWEELFRKESVDITQEDAADKSAGTHDKTTGPNRTKEPDKIKEPAGESEIDRATRDLESALLRRQQEKEEEKRRREERDRLEAERMERIRRQQEEFRRTDEEKKRIEREAMEKLQRQRREKEAKEYKAREKRRQEQENFERSRKRWGSKTVTPMAVSGGYFAGVNTLSGLKKRYKELMKEYHPDNGSGNLDAMNRVQTEYDELLRFFKKVDSHK